MRLKLAIKFLVTAVLLWLVFRKVDLGNVSDLIAGLDPWWGLAALLMTGLIVVFDASLLAEVIRIFSRRMQFGTALLYSLVGWFFSNVAPSTVGGDIFRGVQLSRVGLPIGTAVRVILSVRVLSFITLVVVIAAGFPLALGMLKEQRDVLLLGSVLATGVGAIGALTVLAYAPLRFAGLEAWPLFAKMNTIAGDFRLLLVPGPRTAFAWLAALAQHVLRVGVLVALAAGLGLGIPLATLFAFTTAALLMAMVPISFGGWGVREIAFVYLLGAAGVDAEAALSLSIAFGLLRVLLGVLGGVTWLLINDEHLGVDAPSA
ncbi:MAG: flippase-like domain-containing protein [Sphingomonas sp.]|nr:flippase-like domain-containing protein [Sphingomonas sp.]